MRKFEDKTNGISYSRLNVLTAAIDEYNSTHSDLGTITFVHNDEQGEISFVPKSVRYRDTYEVDNYVEKMNNVLGVLKYLTYINYNLDFTIPDENLTNEEFTELVNEVLDYLYDSDYDSYYGWERTGERIASILYSVYSDYQEDDDE